MRAFDDIYAIAAGRKDGPEALEALLSCPKTPAELTSIPDDRWLSMMARCLFQAGFNWKVIDSKWEGFEAAFDGFDVGRVAFYHDEDMDRLLSDKRIVRNGAKIAAVIDNARFLSDLSRDHGSAARFFADWPNDDLHSLHQLITKQGARLGAATGQRFLRWMGSDTYILSTDVVARLVAEGIVQKQPTSKRDLAAVQQAFNAWSQQSARGMTQISQILAFSA